MTYRCVVALGMSAWVILDCIFEGEAILSMRDAIVNVLFILSNAIVKPSIRNYLKGLSLYTNHLAFRPFI